MCSAREDEDSLVEGGPDAVTEHAVTVTERGSFAMARCSCGWSAPARRARDRARRDAREHLG